MCRSQVAQSLKIAIMGPPGSGKGTLAERIVSHFHIRHISCGDYIRANIKAQTCEYGDMRRLFINIFESNISSLSSWERSASVYQTRRTGAGRHRRSNYRWRVGSAPTRKLAARRQVSTDRICICIFNASVVRRFFSSISFCLRPSLQDFLEQSNRRNSWWPVIRSTLWWSWMFRRKLLSTAWNIDGFMRLPDEFTIWNSAHPNTR